MKNPDPVDYQAALDEFRREEHKPDNPVRSSRKAHNPPMVDGYVDYQAAKAWDKDQAGKYVIYTVEHEEEGRTSMLKPKILMFIALCNYKIDNINRAYCIAKQGLDAVDEAIENSVFTGVPRSMYGADTLEEIIRTIENARYEDVEDEDDYYIIDPEEIDLARFEEIMGNQSFDASSRQFIHTVIKAYDDLRTNLMGAFLQGNQKAIQIVMMLQDFVCPVFYAWEYFGYGKMSDIWKEDLAVDTFEKFKSSDILSETRKAYNSISNGFFPFRAIDQDGGLCESTKMVLEVLIERLES
jgi:hypothetical protein